MIEEIIKTLGLRHPSVNMAQVVDEVMDLYLQHTPKKSRREQQSLEGQDEFLKVLTTQFVNTSAQHSQQDEVERKLLDLISYVYKEKVKALT